MRQNIRNQFTYTFIASRITLMTLVSKKTLESEISISNSWKKWWLLVEKVINCFQNRCHFRKLGFFAFSSLQFGNSHLFDTPNHEYHDTAEEIWWLAISTKKKRKEGYGNHTSQRWKSHIPLSVVSYIIDVVYPGKMCKCTETTTVWRK